MHNLKQGLLLLGALGLSACGMLNPPSKVPSPDGSTPDVPAHLTPQGIAPGCSVTAGGNFPYGAPGPMWQQHYALNDHGIPLNYSTFSTSLKPEDYFKLTPYTINASGSKSYPIPVLYQYHLHPQFSIAGRVVGANNDKNIPANYAYLSPSVSYGLVYQATTRDYALPVNESAPNYKTIDPNTGVIQNTVLSGGRTTYATLNGNRVNFPGNQPLKLEFYLDPTVKTSQEVIQVNYRETSPTGPLLNDWVKVNMPYQDAYLKVTATRYNVYEPTGMKTYTTAAQPLPIFKFKVRGFNNVPSSEHRFKTLRELYYARPYGIGSDQASMNQWLDQRDDVSVLWELFDRKVGRASLDSNQNPVVDPASLTDPSKWNLGTPGYTNDVNCISKTFSVENAWHERNSIIQPKSSIQSTASFNDTQQGLKTEYFDNVDFTKKRTEGLTSNFSKDWGGWSPAPYISPETYSIRWSGSIKPEFSEEYTFYFTGGHGAQLIINGQPVVSLWDVTTPGTQSGKVTLKAGESYDLFLEYKHNT